MAKTAIKAAVVGHANAGKTSLMRTLLRDVKFGAVSNHPGTTRHVEGGTLMVSNEPIIDLYDTPGLEDSMGLLDELEALFPQRSADGIERLRDFLDHIDRYPQYQQEAKVIRQLLNSDLLFYVIDCREPVLGKYRDEIRILGFAAKPVIPILNFVASGTSQTAAWRDQLARQGLHAAIEFDTVVFSFEGEKRLYQKIQSLLGERYDEIQRLIDDRQQSWQMSWQAGTRCIAELLVDAGGYRLEASDAPGEARHELDTLQKTVRKAETQCNKSLLQLFRFSADHLDATLLHVEGGRWQADLFDPANLKQFGVKAGSAAMRGAAAGAGIDLLTGGLSLGVATALGAAAGVLLGGGKRFGKEISARARGYHYLCVEDETLQVLWHRQNQLLTDLQDRGHAAQQPLQLSGRGGALPPAWGRWLKLIRSNSDWSRLMRRSGNNDPDREKLIREIADYISSSHGERRSQRTGERASGPAPL